MKSTNYVLLFIGFLFFGMAAFSQDYQKIGRVKYIEKYYTVMDQGIQAPTIFALHFMGSKPEEFEKLLKTFNLPVRVVYIAGRYKYGEGYSFYPEKYYDWINDSRKAKCQVKTTKRLKRFIVKFKKRNLIHEPVIITGVSQGGDLSYLLALNYPQLIKLSIPIAASVQKSAVKSRPFSNPDQQIYAFHGTIDAIIPVSEAREISEYLKEMKFNINLLEFKDRGHEVSIEMKHKFTELLKQQLKN